jgi:tRNA dimethylallyltransferase
MYPLVVIVGPTASGKSDLALSIAGRFNGEIVNYDSVQIYKYLNIGTAKPTFEEQQRVRHHMIDIREPTDIFTAGDYQREARAVIDEIRSRNVLPILVGGTGLYLRALTEGLFNGPSRSLYWRNRLEMIAERKGRDYLHRLLQRLDSVAASRIAVRDKPKVIRALEVRLQTGRALSEHLDERPRVPLVGYATCRMGLNLDRQILYERIDRRVERMFRTGLVEEVQQLLAMGIPRSAKPFEAIGYRHVLVSGDSCPRAELISIIQRDTRRYAKRQVTWFRNDPGIAWFDGSGDNGEIQDKAHRYLEAWLEKLKRA